MARGGGGKMTRNSTDAIDCLKGRHFMWNLARTPIVNASQRHRTAPHAPLSSR